MNCTKKIIGFHGTTHEHIKSIEENGFEVSKSTLRSDHWLGRGVYFFENEEEATWWSKTKSQSDKSVVFKVFIECVQEDICDFRENLNVRKLHDHIKDMYTLGIPGFKLEMNNKQALTMVYESFKKEYNYYVLINNFQKTTTKVYINYNDEDYNVLRQFFGTKMPKYNEVQICVSKDDYIKIIERIGE